MVVRYAKGKGGRQAMKQYFGGETTIPRSCACANMANNEISDRPASTEGRRR